MKSIRFLAVAASLSLAGCITQEELRSTNQLSIRKSEAPGRDYIVSMRNLVAAGHDPDDQSYRHKTALEFAAPSCPNGRVVGDSSIRTGTYLTGRADLTYEVAIRCGK